MALRQLKRVACVALGHGQCECRPFQLIASNYCTASAQTKRSSNIPKLYPNHLVNLNLARNNSSVPNDRTSNPTTNTNTNKTNLSTKDKLKKLWKNYGIVAVSTYLGIYATTLGSIFLALDFDLFNAASVGLDPTYAIEKVILELFLDLRCSNC